MLVPLFFHYFYPTKGTTPVHVRIEEGDTVSSVAAQLESKGIITSSTIFRMMAWFGSREGKIKAGDYMLFTGMHYGEVFDTLEKGSKVVARVTIPEGFTEEQVATRIGNTGAMTAEEFLAAASEGGYGLSWLPPGQEDNLEGFLFPKTYDLLEGMGPHDVVSMLLAQFQAETDGLDWSLAEQRGLTPYQVVVAASIIEREVVVAEERPLVAAVIYNRLARNMRLQMCSTVQYLLAGTERHPDLRRPGDRLALQHLPERRAAARAHLQPRPGQHRGRPPPRPGGLPLLRGHGRGQPALLHGRLQRVPAGQAAGPELTARAGRTPADTCGYPCRRLPYTAFSM